MRRTWIAIAAASLLALPVVGAGIAGCGQDKVERGLAPADEQAIPFEAEASPSEDAEAEKKMGRADESEEAADRTADIEPETDEPRAEQP